PFSVTLRYAAPAFFHSPAHPACIRAARPYNPTKPLSLQRTLSMLWAVSYTQHLDPLAKYAIPWSALWSTLIAGVPVLLLFYLLVPRRWHAPRAGAAAALSAFLIAFVVYGMPPQMAAMAFVDGAGYGLLPVGWTVFTAMMLYNITVKTGKFD